MPEHPRYSDKIVNPETHHETSDVNVKALIWFGVIFIVFAIVAHLTLGMLFKLYVRIERHRNTNQMTDIRQAPDMSVPKNQPLLQPFPHRAASRVIPPYRNTPVTDLADLRAGEDRALHSYGWVDRQKGVVRIPIEEAMKLTVQRGLPVQSVATPNGAPASAGPTPAQAGAPSPNPGVHP